MTFIARAFKCVHSKLISLSTFDTSFIHMHQCVRYMYVSLSLLFLASVRHQESQSPSALGYMALHLHSFDAVSRRPSPVWTVNQLVWGNCGQVFSVFVLAACHVSGTKTVRIRLAIEAVDTVDEVCGARRLTPFRILVYIFLQFAPTFSDGVAFLINSGAF